MLGVKDVTPAEMLQKKLRYHPLRVFTYLIILGISSAFLTLMFCYFATTAGSVWNKFILPPIFHTNTVIILASSYTVWQMRRANLRGDHTGYKIALLVTALLGVAFTVFQLIGWGQLLHSGVSFKRHITGSYLYLISGLHLLHLLAGVGLLLWFLYKAYLVDGDAYKALIFETDPVAKLRIEMLGLYWHFVDGLWLFVYVCFLVAIYLLPGSMDGWYTRQW